MVFVARFKAVANLDNISQIIGRVKNLTFVLECNQTQVLPFMGDPSDPIRIKTPVTQPQVVIEGTLYGNYVGIKEIFIDILNSVDGIKDTVIFVKKSSAFTKYTIVSGLVTASIVFTVILLTQLDIDSGVLNVGNWNILIPILIGASLAFGGSFVLEMLILTKERIRQ